MKRTKERLLAAIARYAKGRAGRLCAREFCRFAAVSHGTVAAHFGGFGGLLRAARLHRREHKRMGIGEGELLEEYHRLVTALKRHPKWSEVQERGRFSQNVYFRRFGKTRAVREVYERWRRGRGDGPARDWRVARAAKGEFPLGAPLGDRRVMHAPTSEAGVIHVFGVLSEELGYSVASIRGAFPDCLAYKAAGQGRWKPVRIEFELRSSHFRLHGHDPKGCDLVVCWEDDWEGCPVEVVELRREIERVKGER